MNKNQESWNLGAKVYSEKLHTDERIKKIAENPASAFHHAVFEVISKYLPDLRGKKICVPSSGDNHAVFAFTALGARVTSCDFAENQLINAKRVAEKYGWADSIDFKCEDTMKLCGVKSEEYDFVYTSNGVHVWIDNLADMYTNIYRILKPGGIYIMYDIHPFQRPFDDDANIIKPYDMTGPFDDGNEVTYNWRLSDIQNAMTDSGLTIKHTEEVFAEKDYDFPFWLPLDDYLKGVRIPREEVDRRYDWKQNPIAALPDWLCLAAVK